MKERKNSAKNERSPNGNNESNVNAATPRAFSPDLYSFPSDVGKLTDLSDEEEVGGYRSPAPSRLSDQYEDQDDDDDDDDEEEYGEEGEELMEIQIEALTGTKFRVPVSPKETIVGLKALLYRTEGLPISQQHMLLGNKELVDNLTLGEQGVREGSVLRLVISLKGGPIQARKPLPPEDQLWREVSEMMEDKSDDMFESSGGRAVTLLVLRDGDSVNLYRVVEHEDGSFSPLNQSWGSSTGTNLERSFGSRTEEDKRTEAKMADLKAKMEALKVKNKKKRKPRSGTKRRPGSGSAKGNKNISPQNSSAKPLPKLLQSHFVEVPPDSMKDVSNKIVKTEQKRPKSGNFKRAPRIRTGNVSRPSTQERSIELRKTSSSRTSMMLEDFPHSQKSRDYFFSGKRPLDNIKPKTDKSRLGRVDEYSSGSKSFSVTEKGSSTNYSAYRQSLVKHGKKESIDTSRDRRDRKGRPPVIRRNVPPIPLYMDESPSKPRRDVDPLYSSHNNFDRLSLSKELDNRPKTSPEVLERRPMSTSGQSTTSERIQLRHPDSQLIDLVHMLNTSSKNSVRRGSRVTISPPQTTPRSFDTSFSNSNGSSVAGATQKRTKTPLSSSLASIQFGSSFSKPSTPNSSTLGSTSFNSTASKEQTELLREIIKSTVNAGKPASRLSTPDTSRRPRRPVSGRGHIPASPARLPPVTPSRKKKGKRRPRCSHCNTKIGITSTFFCRCGRPFCAEHRYAETHSCTYDYKSEGRKFLHMANPLVEPQKLPKI